MAGARTSTSLATQSRAANQAARDTDVVIRHDPAHLGHCVLRPQRPLRDALRGREVWS